MTKHLRFIENFSITSRQSEMMNRMIKVTIVLAFFFGLCFYFKDFLLFWLEDPLPSKYKGNLIFISPSEPFFSHMKVSFMGALFIAMPYILYQAWFFISPDIRANKQKSHRSFVTLGTLYFIFGGVFCYFLILPSALEYLLRDQPWL